MDNLKVITIEYEADFQVRRSNGGGEMEDTGQRVRDSETHTVVCGSQMVEFAEKDAIAQLQRSYDNCKIHSASFADVSMFYPSPRYRV